MQVSGSGWLLTLVLGLWLLTYLALLIRHRQSRLYYNNSINVPLPFEHFRQVHATMYPQRDFQPVLHNRLLLLSHCPSKRESLYIQEVIRYKLRSFLLSREALVEKEGVQSLDLLLLSDLLVVILVSL